MQHSNCCSNVKNIDHSITSFNTNNPFRFIRSKFATQVWVAWSLIVIVRQNFCVQISCLNVFVGVVIYHRGFGNVQLDIRRQNACKFLSWLSSCLSALYSLAAFFIFILLPFMYFYFEEKDDGNVTAKEVHFLSSQFIFSRIFICWSVYSWH